MGRRNKGPQLVILGPDRKHGARPTPGFKEYCYYAEWYERGRRRLRSLDRRVGESYQARLQEVRLEVASSLPAKRGAIDAKIGVVLLDYLRDRRSKVLGVAELQSRVKRLIVYFGNTSVSKLTEEMCEQYARTHSRMSTARVALQTLRTALTWGHKQKIFHVPIPRIPLPHAGSPRDRVYSRNELSKIIREFRRHPRGRHLIFITLLAYYTGARIQSIIDLRWERSNLGGWIDLDGGFIHLNPADRVITKKRKPTLIIPVKLFTLLRAMKRWQVAGKVCRNKLGDTVSYTAVFSRQWKKCLADAGVAPGVPHSLRHSRITHLIAGGITTEIVASYVGADPITIHENYAHLRPEHGGAAARFRK